MKIFMGLYNWGTQAGLHALLLRKRGWDSVSVVISDKYDRLGDRKIYLPNNVFLSLIYKLIFGAILLVRYFKNNVFIFYGGVTFLPFGVDLPILRLFKKTVLFYYMGNDVQGYYKSIKKYKYTNMRFYKKNQIMGLIYDAKISIRIAIHRIYAERQIVCAPYLSEFVSGSVLIPLYINTDDYLISPVSQNKNLIIMHAPTNRMVKGTLYFEEAVDKLINLGYPVEKRLIENLSHDAIREAYRNCDIFVDQLLSGWYGTASIEAMASGKPVVCFLRNDYRKYCNYFDEIPIINANPDNIFDCLKALVNNREELKKIGLSSRRFCEKYHSTDYIAPILEEIIAKKNSNFNY